jgi:hypothetical protein
VLSPNRKADRDAWNSAHDIPLHAREVFHEH